MIKYLKKLLMVSNTFYLNLIIKKTPFYFNELMQIFNSPIDQAFDHPVTTLKLDEKSPENFDFKIKYFIFINNKTYTFNKLKKRGRIKRKIRRKLILKNKFID